MKKLILVLCVLFSLNLDAQFVTTLAKNAAMPQEGGVMYSLPRNVIGIEFTVEETHYQMGPYSEYASNLLGLTNYIRENKTEINIIDADVFTGTEADPQTVYFINQDEKSKEPMPNIILNEDGVILAIGYDSIPFKATITSNKLIYNNLAITAADDITFIDIVETNEDDDDEEWLTAMPHNIWLKV